jgi:hypothetical protein
MTANVDEAGPLQGRIGLYRLLIGAAQGLALYFAAKAWDGNPGEIWIAGAFCAALLAPAVALAEIGRMPGRWLALWFLVAAVVLGLLGVWAAWREVDRPAYPMGVLYGMGFAIPAEAVLLFIAHHLVAVGVEERRWIAPYPAYFDSAWRQALQVELSGLFLGIFWLVMWLGATLFDLIGQKFLSELIKHDWFWIPVSAVVFAGAVHLTDVRIALIRGFRTVVLALFAVLLPLVSGLSALFIVLGAFTGMKGVWTAQGAAAILLAMSLAMILFLNAAYQDGAEERRPGLILRWTMRIAPFLIVILTLISANTVLTLVLRHGWTPDRIVAAAACVIVLAYGLGYAWAAVGTRPFLARLEPTNILTGHLALLVGLFLLSPVGDPARLSVDSQVTRLTTGRIKPAQFDYDFLAHRADRFGVKALAALTKSPNAEIAHLALAPPPRLFGGRPGLAPNPAKPFTAADLASHIEVHPAGAVLPPRFAPSVLGHADAFIGPSCLTGDGQCLGYLIDLDHDGNPELLLWQGTGGVVFKEAPDGAWRNIGNLAPFCQGIGDAIRADQVTAKPPALDEIDIGGARVRVVAQYVPCPATVRAQKPAAQGKPASKP